MCLGGIRENFDSCQFILIRMASDRLVSIIYARSNVTFDIGLHVAGVRTVSVRSIVRIYRFPAAISPGNKVSPRARKLRYLQANT